MLRVLKTLQQFAVTSQGFRVDVRFLDLECKLNYVQIEKIAHYADDIVLISDKMDGLLDVLVTVVWALVSTPRFFISDNMIQCNQLPILFPGYLFMKELKSSHTLSRYISAEIPKFYYKN